MQTFLWLSTAGLLGVLLAVPLRRHFIVDEKLPFADGIAAGETLIVLDSRGRAGAASRPFSMVGALVASGLADVLDDARTVDRRARSPCA